MEVSLGVDSEASYQKSQIPTRSYLRRLPSMVTLSSFHQRHLGIPQNPSSQTRRVLNSRLLSLPEPAVYSRKHQPHIFRCRTRKLNPSPVSSLHDGMQGSAIEMAIANEERPKDIVHIYDFRVNSLIRGTVYEA